jgi:hypothetical protein
MTGMASLRAAGLTRGTGQSITPRLAVQVVESRHGQVPNHGGIHRVLLGGGSVPRIWLRPSGANRMIA